MTLPANSQLIEADERLATVLSHFYCVQQPAQAALLSQQLLPNYEMLLVFNFGPAISFTLGDATYEIQQTAVVGPLQKMLRYELGPGADLIAVNFTLNGFYRLLGIPMHQFKASGWTNADALLNSDCYDDLWRQLAQLNTVSDRLQRISDYALAHLAPADAVTDSLRESIPYFKQMTIDPVKAIAQQQQISTRSIQNRFQTHLGYSAKELARFLRFKKVLGFLSQRSFQAVDWVALVLDFGYHDHSHLIKDFHYFLGTTPRQFLKQIATGDVCMSQSGKFY